MSKKIAELDTVLRKLEQTCDLDGSALVTEKGQMVCSSLPEGSEEKAVSAMAAAIMLIGKRVGAELKMGALKSTRIDGIERSIILRGLGNVVLVGQAPSNSEFGLIHFELNRASDKILSILGG